MRLRSPATAAVLAAVALFAALAWWLLRPRASLEGVASRIASGQLRAAEGQLRAYLAGDPRDESARLMLARVLVDRPEPAPEEALGLVEGVESADPHRASRVRAVEGDAHFWLGHYDRAEAAWLEALQLDPKIPEVGWKLLNIYAAQGRDEDSRRLGLRLFAIEPDQVDQVQLLLQLIRHDAHSIEAGSVVHELEPVVRSSPEDDRSSTALALALLRTGRADEGMDLLRRRAGSRRDDLDVQLAYLDGLMTTGNLDELAEALGRLPKPLADSPRVDAVRGWLASQQLDLEGAARAYRRALDGWPAGASLAHSTLAYRFKGVLRQAGRVEELAELEPRLEAIFRFPVVVRDLFDRINTMPDLGIRSHPEVFSEVAKALAGVGRDEEARAWESLARKHAGGSP